MSIRSRPEAAEEQNAALSAYERGTVALDSAKRTADMGTVSRTIAEGQYHLACTEALAADRPAYWGGFADGYSSGDGDYGAGDF